MPPKRSRGAGAEEEEESRVRLSVVVPAYNEELRLPKMLDEALEYLEKRANQPTPSKRPLYGTSQSFDYEIIIVDDGSYDGTTACGLRYRKKFGDNRIRVITLEKNRGKGGAVRAGVLAARGDYVLFADADGASKFSHVEKLEDFMYDNRESELLVAIGSRAHMEKEALASRSLFRNLLMKAFHLLVWTCCVRSVRDTQCGFKMFNRRAARLLFSTYRNESWAFDVELLYLAEQMDCTIGEVPIGWEEVGGSKIVPVFSWARMGWDVICISALYTLGIYTLPQLASNRDKSR